MSDTSVVLISWSPNEYRRKLLQQSLASIREHTYMDHTLIVIDNGPIEQREIIKDAEPDIHIINDINKGVGVSRNQGARLTKSEFIAFVDSDIGYFPDWLAKCVGVLEEYPDRKLIASAVKNKPMRLPKYDRGPLGEYHLYGRCAGMAMVMRRSAYNEIGHFHELKTNVGHQFCAAAKRCGYMFVHHPEWAGRHLGRKSAYHYKKQQFLPETGEWVSRKRLA